MAIGAAIASVAGAAMQYGQAQSNAKSMHNQNTLAAIQSKFQQEMLEERKADILKQGDEQANERMTQLRQMLGSQKVAFAAQGIEVEGELGRSLAEDAKRTAEADYKAIKNNAWKQAMGIEMDQRDLSLQRDFDKMVTNARIQDAEAQGLSSIVQGAGQVASIGMKSGWFGPGQRSGSTKKIPTGNKTTYNYQRSNRSTMIA